MRIIRSLKRNIFMGLMAASIISSTSCGRNASSVTTDNPRPSTEVATVAKAKDIQMQVKDSDGNTITLTGDAAINEAGEMVFEGKDSAGNVVKVTGTAEKTEDGSFKVKEAAIDGTTKVVADNGQETEVSKETTGDVTVDEIKDTVNETVDNIENNISNSGNANNSENGEPLAPSDNNNNNNTGNSNVTNNNSNNNNNNNDSNDNKHSDSTPEKPNHTHTWNPVTATVHHEATGHYEDVVVGTRTVIDKEAWDEPVYEWQYTKARCKACGQIFDTGDEWDKHSMYYADVLDDWSHGSYEVIAEKVQVDMIHHEAETHEEDIKEKCWVEDTAAYDETVITGYVCSCGATR